MSNSSSDILAKIQISEKDGKLTIEISSSENKQSVASGDDPPSYVDCWGNLYWKDKKGQNHRDGDKPAVIWTDGCHVHYKNGLLHRDGDKPAIYYPNGKTLRTLYYKNGVLHRDGNKPSVITDYSYEYWVDGNLILKVNHENGVVEI